MKDKTRMIHFVEAKHYCWDPIEHRWMIWPKYVGYSNRAFHSARRARRDFEKLKIWSLGEARWTTYKNGNLVKVREYGYWKQYYLHKTISRDTSSNINTVSVWDKCLCNILYECMSKRKAAVA